MRDMLTLVSTQINMQQGIKLQKFLIFLSIIICC